MVVYKHVKVDITNFDQFVITDYRRKIREGPSLLLAQALAKDHTFQNPLHVNKTIDGKYRIIDGNHRIEAVRVCFRRDPQAQFDIPLAIHENLTESEERDLFDELAKTVNQTMHDYIRIHFEEVPLFKKIDHEFSVPVSIYSQRTGLTFGSLIRFWYSRESAIPKTIGKQDTILFAKSSIKDYSEMSTFFQYYKNFFGNPSQSNPYWKYYVTWTLGSIYFRNRKMINEAKIWERLHNICFGNVIILDMAKTNSYDYAVDARRIVLDKMNHGWRGTPFV